MSISGRTGYGGTIRELHRTGIHANISSAVAQEIETTLVVIHDDPADLMEGIASLRSLGGYRLAPGRSGTLRDTYYDTPSRLLSNRGIAVRTRMQGETTVFCIKQDERTDDAGATIREEIELPWSRQCIDYVAHILHKVSSGIHEVPSLMTSPGESLGCLGLLPIQARETVRLVLHARHPEGPTGEVVSEIALDRVCYSISSFRILHHEIEIEAASPDGLGAVMDLTGLLREHHAESLRPWRHNKLITGIALEQLIAEGRLPVMTGRFTSLNRAAYDEIELVLRDRG